MKQLKNAIKFISELTYAGEDCAVGSRWRREQTAEQVAEICQSEFKRPSLDLAKRWWEIWQKNKTHKEFSLLAGNVTRICSIPEGKALLFPLLNLVDINGTSQPVSELRAEIAACLDRATGISLVVDGQAVPAKLLARSRVHSVPFAAVIPPEGVPTNPPKGCCRHLFASGR